MPLDTSPARPRTPATRPVAVPRAFIRDFNRVDHFFDWSEAQRSAAKAHLRRDPGARADLSALAALLPAFEQVACHYDWNAEERAEWHAPLRQPGHGRAYIAALALALQHGYDQGAYNDYRRLDGWLADHGFTPGGIDGELQ